MENNLKVLEKSIDYCFNDKKKLKKALTHSSYVNENNLRSIDSNERLEFLGDAILGLIVSEHLYKKYPMYPEGKLTKLRAKVVCEQSLSFMAKELGVGEYLLLGKGEEATGGRLRESILADALEAIIGAIYLDSNYPKTSTVIWKTFESQLKKAINDGLIFVDYKTSLQEKIQKKNNGRIEYIVQKEEGPDHGKTFYIDVFINNKAISMGKGRSKKEAEQNAARKALKKFGDKKK